MELQDQKRRRPHNPAGPGWWGTVTLCPMLGTFAGWTRPYTPGDSDFVPRACCVYQLARSSLPMYWMKLDKHPALRRVSVVLGFVGLGVVAYVLLQLSGPAPRRRPPDRFIVRA